MVTIFNQQSDLSISHIHVALLYTSNKKLLSLKDHDDASGLQPLELLAKQ